MKIAVLGTGTVGTALATKLLETGHDVTFASRSPRAGLVAPALGLTEAVRGADLIVNATPGGQSLDVLRTIGAEALGTTVLLDVANAVDDSFNLLYPNDSLARLIQEEFPNLRVVKSLNTMNTSVMTNPSILGSTTVFLSGNDAGAKSTVGSILSDLGWPDESQVDLGDISTARGTEAHTLLFFAVLFRFGSPVFNVDLRRQG